MLPFGHAAGGYLTGTVLGLITKSEDAKKLRMLGLMGGLLPDLDLIGYSVLKKPLSLDESLHHHEWITHTFPFYILLGASVMTLAKLVRQDKLSRSIGVITVSACVHLIQDMFGSGDGIQLFFPFSKRMVGFRLLNAHGREWRKKYLQDPISLIEITTVLLSLLVAKRIE